MKIKKQIPLLIFFFLVALTSIAQRLFSLSGALLEADSQNVIPFAYVINLNSQNGVVTAGNGSFVINASENDSLQFSCIGYEKLIIRVSAIPNLNDSTKAYKKFYLKRKVYDLGMVYVTKIKIKPNEREYMNRIINRPKVQNINIAESPITALWQNFSKKGRELQKLEAIFVELLRDEQIEKKLNTEILRKLLENENITLEKFRIMCPEITDDFILQHEGYELYSAVSQSYKYHLRSKK
jgi:hypothetical protein